MKQSLHLRLGQQLTMTPQLQQAIKLLQMSTLDLQQEIQQALDSNIMLEINDEESSPKARLKIRSRLPVKAHKPIYRMNCPSILHGTIFMRAH